MSRHERADRLAQVRSQVNYHGERLALYRRLHGSAPSARLQDLEQAYLSARDRLARCAATPDRERVVEPRLPAG
jgi:hypothetical protein